MYEDEMDRDMSEVAGMFEHESLVWNLIRAEVHARQALDQLYKENGPKRSFWYRRLLLKSQSRLMTLLMRELAHAKRRI